MGEIFLAREVVRFDNPLNVISMNANCYPHKKMLWSFGHFTIHTEKVGVF